jgi:hypothetical protein
MICNWATDCARCDGRVEEGDDIFFATGLLGTEKICWTCAFMDGLACECGNQKKQGYASCWDCKLEREEAEGLRCACGGYKKPEYETCYTCKTEGDG